jgi:penicillin amidase
VPIRRPENALRGLAPAPGWDARYDWTGYIAFDELPRAYNPPEGEIVTANQKIVPEGYTHFITSEWQPPYRAWRIRERLDAASRHTMGSFARIQTDVVSLPLRELLPRLTAIRPRSVAGRRALALLARWDATMAMGGAEPLIAAAWWRALARALYADELGESFRSHWRTRAQFVSNVLADRDGQSRWCDDVRTPARESCDELLAGSLEAALADLRGRYGADMSRWQWGQAHVAHSEHRPLTRSPLLAKAFDIRVPSPGDGYTVNAGRSHLEDEDEPYANRQAPSLRAIYDLADPNGSWFIHSGGQSGNPLSAQYAAFAKAWGAGEYIPMITDRGRLEAAGARLLTLAPAAAEKLRN